MKIASENACWPRARKDLRLAWDRSSHKDDSWIHQTRRYHPTPEQTVDVAVKADLRRLVVADEVAAAAVAAGVVVVCLAVAWAEMVGTRLHPQKRRWDLLGRACRLVDRTPVLAHHNGFETVTDSSWVVPPQNLPSMYSP